MRSSILVFAVLLVLASPLFLRSNVQGDEQSQAQDEKEKKNYFYQWTDKKGVVHISDGLGKVPQQYRSSAKRVESASGEVSEDGNKVRNDDSEPAGYSEDEERNADLKEVWQQRMRDAKKHLAETEQRYRALDQKRTEVLGRGGVYAVPEIKLEAAQIAEEMKTVQKEIDDTRHQIDVVIPEEARKAGIPPGWLRD